MGGWGGRVGRRGQVLLRQPQMQRHKDVKHRAGSGTHTQEGLLGCGQGVGCCTGDKAESVSRSRPGAPCGLCPPPKTILCAPHLFRPNLIFTKWLQALTSSQVLGLSPGCEETRSGSTGLPWPFREGQPPWQAQPSSAQPSPALLEPQRPLVGWACAAPHVLRTQGFPGLVGQLWGWATRTLPSQKRGVPLGGVSVLSHAGKVQT